MSKRFFVLITIVAVAALPLVVAREVGARCSYLASYPQAFGQWTYMLATATPQRIDAPIDTPYYSRPHNVLAQLMRVSDVAGYQAEVIREGLQAGDSGAVFVRYRIGPSCAPFPAFDGLFDTVGEHGLYVGKPRRREHWVGGRPTFDVYRAQHFPLPQRLGAASGHVVIVKVGSRPTMSSSDLFAMYRTLWAESIGVADVAVHERILHWIAMNPTAATKQPTEEVAIDMLSAVQQAKIAASSVPYSGIYAITAVVTGMDSVTMFGRTKLRSMPFEYEIVRDDSTGVPINMQARSYAIDLTTARTRDGFEGPNLTFNECSPIAIVVNDLPIRLAADSSWSGDMSPSRVLSCAAKGSVLHSLTVPHAVHSVAFGPARVTFQKHPDGRVTFEANSVADGKASVFVRGERVAER